MSADASKSVVEQPCLLCGTKPYRTVKTFRDGVVVGRCRSCDFIYTPARVTNPAGLLENIQGEKMRVLVEPIVSGRIAHYRDKNYREYVSIIGRHAPGKRLLDVGCAQGFFPWLAQKQGYQVAAVEPSRPMAAFAKDVLGIDVMPGRLDQVDLSGREFDAVSFTDSLEYFPDPVRDLSRVASHLVPGGIVFVRVPNADYFRLWHRLSTMLRVRVGTDAAFGPSLRVAHYDRRSLERLMIKAGLTVVAAGSPRPIQSTYLIWRKMTGLSLIAATPWHIGLRTRMTRSALDFMGQLERPIVRTNHLSQSIYAVGRRPR